jgi:hypothetical protein
MAASIRVLANAHKEADPKGDQTMRTLAPALLAALALVSGSVLAQTSVRLRGTISELKGDVLMVKSRDGRDIRLHLAPDAQVSTPKEVPADQFKPGAYVGVTSLKGPDGRLVAKTVHALPPQVPSGHMARDSIPNSMMTNAHITSVVAMGTERELTLKYKDGEQKILVTPQTKYITFVPGSRADLKPGEAIFAVARVEGDGSFSTQRITVGKGGVKPPQ